MLEMSSFVLISHRSLLVDWDCMQSYHTFFIQDPKKKKIQDLDKDNNACRGGVGLLCGYYFIVLASQKLPVTCFFFSAFRELLPQMTT